MKWLARKSAPRDLFRGTGTTAAPLALVAGLAGCGGEEAPSAPSRDAASTTLGEAPGRPWFEECAVERGLRFEHTTGFDGTCLFPEILAGGGALADLDSDGDLDAYLVQSGHLAPDRGASPSNRLFANDGSGHFEDVTDASGTGDRGYGMGAVYGDADNDGDPDLYVLNLDANVLYANEGGLRFRDATTGSGTELPAWSVSGAFFDAENDGDLDLFVVNYIVWSLESEIECRRAFNESPDYCSPKQYQAPAPDTLLLNDGTGGFTDVSSEAGLRKAFGNGLGVVCSDFDADGWTDVFVANDGTPNQLWHNEGAARFTDSASKRGFAYDQHGFAKAGMGIAAGDVDADGDEDVIVVNQGGEADSFYRNDDGRYLFDATLPFGLGAATRPFTRFGVALADFDADGILDLYEANGRVERASPPKYQDPYAEPNVLLRGLGNGRFEEVLPRGGTSAPLIATSRGAAFGDIDGDGGLDVLVINRDGPAHLLRNVVAERGPSWRIRLCEPSGRDALGARLTVRGEDWALTRVARSAFSYASANDPAVHVSWSARTSPVALEVLWIDGTREGFDPPPAQTTSTTLVRGTGRPLGS